MKKPLFTDTEYPDEIHRVPNEDLCEHLICGSCWCKPKRLDALCVEHGVHFLWFHNALDGREFYPDGRIPLQ